MLTFVLFDGASCEWIAHVATQTFTVGQMIDSLTESILTTSTRTRILAFAIDACTIGWTVSVQTAFNIAAFIRIAEIAWLTLAGAGVVLFATNGVNTTGTWFAWTRRQVSDLRSTTSYICIANVAI